MLMRWLDWFVRDRRSGRIVVGQWPNLPLWLFGLAAVMAIVMAGSTVGLWADMASRVFLVWWAADELLRGVDPWRRFLGAAVLVGISIRILA